MRVNNSNVCLSVFVGNYKDETRKSRGLLNKNPETLNVTIQI